MKKRGFFVSFEGTDGTGKTTHAKRLKTWLARRGISCVLTREPGGGPLAEKIRGILLDPRLSMSDITELFLYEAARAEHVRRVIEPALKKGSWVVCDRFTDATLAYQGSARGISLKVIERLNQIATGGVSPSLTLWFDLPAKHGLAKAKARGKGDRLENEGLKFQQKVRAGYASIHRRYPRRVRRIAVQDTVEATQALVRKTVERFL